MNASICKLKFASFDVMSYTKLRCSLVIQVLVKSLHVSPPTVFIYQCIKQTLLAWTGELIRAITALDDTITFIINCNTF